MKSEKLRHSINTIKINVITFRNICMAHHEGREVHEVFSSVPSVPSW